MASFEGTTQEFHHYIGPRIRNAVNSLTRKARLERNDVCEFCGKKATLESAHAHGMGRREIIEGVLINYTDGKTIRIPDLNSLEQEILDAHQPLSSTFKFICKPCHTEYDSNIVKPTKESLPFDQSEYEGQTITIGSCDFPLERNMKNASPTKSYFLSIMPDLLKLLPDSEIQNLADIEFCRSHLSTNYSVITEDNSVVFDSNGRRRYYPNLVNDRYYICNDWYDERSRNNLAKWREYLIDLGTRIGPRT
ncbi:hypothetical protein [Pseudodesulfovibrio sp.]|uniref:hypothetical protein n=1 Tax=unclassified Pseudodesulfovibrio TaxID=2661612 RepID=UPI003B00E3B8